MPAQLVADQGRETRRAEYEQRADLRRTPAVALALDDRVGEARERGDHQHLTDRVDPAGVVCAWTPARTARVSTHAASPIGTLTRNT